MQTRLGLHFVPFPGLSSSGDQVFGKRGAATYHLPMHAAWFSGCTTDAPSQADVDHPESQEVLISKEACLQFGRYFFSGAVIAPFWLWLPVTGGGWSAAD